MYSGEVSAISREPDRYIQPGQEEVVERYGGMAKWCLPNKTIRVIIKVIGILTHIHMFLRFYSLIYQFSPLTQ